LIDQSRLPGERAETRTPTPSFVSCSGCGSSPPCRGPDLPTSARTSAVKPPQRQLGPPRSTPTRSPDLAAPLRIPAVPGRVARVTHTARGHLYSCSISVNIPPSPRSISTCCEAGGRYTPSRGVSMSPLSSRCARATLSGWAIVAPGRRVAWCCSPCFGTWGLGASVRRRFRPRPATSGGGTRCGVAGMDIGAVTPGKRSSPTTCWSSFRIDRTRLAGHPRHHKLATLSAAAYLEADPAARCSSAVSGVRCHTACPTTATVHPRLPLRLLEAGPREVAGSLRAVRNNLRGEVRGCSAALGRACPGCPPWVVARLEPVAQHLITSAPRCTSW